MCSSIKRLNLKNNLIIDDENIQFLSNLSLLKWLNLNGNPIKKLENYEELIKENLPNLDSLDTDEEFINENDLNNKFLQSQSTFTSSPSFSGGLMRPMTSTGANFYKSDNNDNLINNDDQMAKTMRNFQIKENSDSKNGKSNHSIQGLKAILNHKLSDNKFGETFTNFRMDDNINHDNNENFYKSGINLNTTRKNKPWNSPDRPKFDFSLKNTSNEFSRGKSQIPMTNNELANKNFNFFNPPTLRPVVIKKETPFEIKSFRKSMDEDLHNEIIKNIDKSKFNYKEPEMNNIKNSNIGNKNIESIKTQNFNAFIKTKDVKQLPQKLKINKTNIIKIEDEMISHQKHI